MAIMDYNGLSKIISGKPSKKKKGWFRVWITYNGRLTHFCIYIPRPLVLPLDCRNIQPIASTDVWSCLGEVVSSIAGSRSVIKMELYKSDNDTECDLFMTNSIDEMLLRERTLMLGLLTSMVASQIWQLIATYLAWPVSGTHTIISALMGFTLVENGLQVHMYNS